MCACPRALDFFKYAHRLIFCAWHYGPLLKGISFTRFEDQLNNVDNP